MTVLSDQDIKQAIIDGTVVCRPFVEENVKGSSIDLTLGEWFWRCDANPHGVFDPTDADEIARYFAGPYQAKPYALVYRKLVSEGCDVRTEWPPPAGDSEMRGRRCFSMPSPFKNIPDDWPVIVMRRRERILAHTHEFVGIRGNGTSMLKARSTTGRVGSKVCDDAGWGDPGYWRRWTMEMRNDNDEAIILPCGIRVAQIVLFRAGPVEQSYETIGSYQDSDDVERVIAEWTPEAMLPKPFAMPSRPFEDLSHEAFDKTVGDMIRRRERQERARVSELNRLGSESVPS